MSKSKPRAVAEQVWWELEERLMAAYPPLLAKLPPGATTESIERLERTFGHQLPPLVREMYRLHDGIGMPAYIPSGNHMRSAVSHLLSLQEALDEWHSLTRALDSGAFADSKIADVEGSVRPHWWNRGWLPISSNGAGDCYCIDMDPAPGGAVGQVVSFWHDDAERAVVAADVAEYLLGYVDEEEWAIREQESWKPVN